MSNNSPTADGFKRFILTQLAEEITATPFKSSVRLIMIMSLGISKRMKLTDLMKVTGCGKGSISNHIDKLEQSGFITTREISFFKSPRIIVEITKKGEEFYNRYLDILEKILHSSNQDDESPSIDSDTEKRPHPS